MRSSMVCRSVLRSSPLCCSSSPSVCSIQLQMLFRSELNCCHCCRFCFIRSSLLRAWACRSSQRSMTPAAQPHHHLNIISIIIHVHYYSVLLYPRFETLSCWRWRDPRPCRPHLSAQIPHALLHLYCHDIPPAAASDNTNVFTRCSSIQGSNITTWYSDLRIPCTWCPARGRWGFDCGWCSRSAEDGSSWCSELCPAVWCESPESCRHLDRHTTALY